MDFEMDTSLEKEIARTELHLKMLKTQDPEAVFHCPKCNKDFSQLSNYRELGVCGKCFSKVHEEKLQKMTFEIIGGTIEKIEIGKVDPLQIVDKPEITKLWIKTIKGKTIVLKPPERLIFA